jgi:methionyl-tRNA synthetase
VYKRQEQYRFREALASLMNLARLGNKYLADSEPWKLWDSNPAQVATILNMSLQICANLAIVMEPFMPFSAAKLRRLLKMEQYKWAQAGSSQLLAAGHPIDAASLLFDKISDEEVQRQIDKLQATKAANQAAQRVVEPARPDITFEEFSKMDIRIGTILTAEKVAKTKKLLKLTVDTGIDKRTVVSGIAEFHDPEKIIGQRVVILVNLAPREIKGIVSQGMILMAENAKGELSFVTSSGDLSNGDGVR